jgi:hypothetical protein
MKRQYFCPSCNANLNPNVKVILMARKGGDKGLILLSPQPGNYQVIVAEDIHLTTDDLVEFHCPVCGASLTAETNSTLAHLRFRFSSGREGVAYFARRYGEHATYLVADDHVMTYGDDAMPDSHMNFFGSGQSED